MFVSVKNKKVQIDGRTFSYLFDNSIYYEHNEYLEAQSTGNIAMGRLIVISREASINYALFFVPYEIVVDIVEKENKKLFQGFSGKFTISIRGKKINLNLVRMVVKDLRIKQTFISRYIKTPVNLHPKFLAHSPKSIQDQAVYILDSLGIDIQAMRGMKDKRTAMIYIIDQLEKQNVLVALETSTNMPQNMNHAEGISGVYIKDKRFPYFFIANEGQIDFESGAGRKIFTIMYLIVCMFKGRSRVVSLQDLAKEDEDNELYEIVEEMLLPATDIPRFDHYTIDDLDELSSTYKLTGRAVLMRLKHIDYIKDDNYWQLMNILKSRFNQYQTEQRRLRKDGRARLYIPNVSANIIAYHGKAFIRILKGLYSNGKVTQRQINLHLAYGRREVNSNEVFRRVR